MALLGEPQVFIIKLKWNGTVGLANYDRSYLEHEIYLKLQSVMFMSNRHISKVQTTSVTLFLRMQEPACMRMPEEIQTDLS